MKVVHQGQMDSYYARFCETVEMGLPGRVTDLDVVGEEHEVDNEEEERVGYVWVRGIQRLMDMKKRY